MTVRRVSVGASQRRAMSLPSRAVKRVLVALVVPVASLGLWSCVVQQPAPVTQPTVQSAPVQHVSASAATVAYSAPPPVVASACGATLTVAPVQTRPGCTIDERVSAQSTRVMFPCGGGAAHASFADASFGGAVSPDGTLELSLRTTFHFTDGCDWETKQEIRGSLPGGALAYTYIEHPLPGQQRCARGCEASASVRVDELTR